MKTTDRVGLSPSLLVSIQFQIQSQDSVCHLKRKIVESDERSCIDVAVGKDVAVIEDPRSHHCRDGGNAETHQVVACFADKATSSLATHVGVIDVVGSRRQKFQDTAGRDHYLWSVDTGGDSLDSNNAVRADTELAVGSAAATADAVNTVRKIC